MPVSPDRIEAFKRHYMYGGNAPSPNAALEELISPAGYTKQVSHSGEYYHRSSDKGIEALFTENIPRREDKLQMSYICFSDEQEEQDFLGYKSRLRELREIRERILPPPENIDFPRGYLNRHTAGYTAIGAVCGAALACAAYFFLPQCANGIYYLAAGMGGGMGIGALIGKATGKRKVKAIQKRLEPVLQKEDRLLAEFNDKYGTRIRYGKDALNEALK